MDAFKCYLQITILRGRLGFRLEAAQSKVSHSALMKTIQQFVINEAGYLLTENEVTHCQMRLNELSVTIQNRQLNHLQAKQQEILENYQSFVSLVKKELNYDCSLSEQQYKAFSLHMVKLKLRIHYGRGNENLFKREINRKYPLTAHIVAEYFEDAFGEKIPDAEIAFIILYFASAEISDRSRASLLITNLHPSMAHHIIKILSPILNGLALFPRIVPSYLYIKKHAEYNANYPLVFITERELVTYNQNAILLTPLMNEKNISHVFQQILLELDTESQRKFESMYNQLIGSHCVVSVDEKYDTLESFAINTHIPINYDAYDIVLDRDFLYFPFFAQSKESNIQIYDILHPFRYKGREIKAVVVTQYNPKSQQIHVFDQHNYPNYEQILAADGGIDLVMMGLGEDGHFCGNLQGTVESFDQPAHAVPVDCLPSVFARVNRFFKDCPEKMPAFYYTFGPKTIMQCKNLIVFASGISKAHAVKKLILGPMDLLMPASVFQLHPSLTIILDQDAASECSEQLDTFF